MASAPNGAVVPAKLAADLRAIWSQPGLGQPMLGDAALDAFLAACRSSESAHPGCGLNVVYHWTSRKNLEAIASRGLLVGGDGADGVPVVHGQRLGKGIYASRQFQMGRRFGNIAVLCVGLRGAQERGNTYRLEALSDSPMRASAEERDIIVFRHPSQVLPCAAILADDLGRAIEAASSTIAALYVEFRRLNNARMAADDVIQGWRTAQPVNWIDASARVHAERELAMGLSCVEAVHSISRDHFTVEGQLAEWEVMLTLPEGALTRNDHRTLVLRVLFPKPYPIWAPHLIVMQPRIRCNSSSRLVIAGGGINAESLMQVSEWCPSLRVPFILQAILDLTAEHIIETASGMYCANEVELAMRAHQLGKREPPKTDPRPVPVELPRVPAAAPPPLLRLFSLPQPFAELLEASRQFEAELGGTPNFPGGLVSPAGKLTRNALQVHTAFEHVQLSIQGFARLEFLLPEIQRLNNGARFMENPGTQLLERECGFTMHGDRPGANAVLREAPALLLRAFSLAKEADQLRSFFFEAFDRFSDPCLEGRTSLLTAFIEERIVIDEEEEPTVPEAAAAEAVAVPERSGRPVGLRHFWAACRSFGRLWRTGRPAVTRL